MKNTLPKAIEKKFKENFEKVFDLQREKCNIHKNCLARARFSAPIRAEDFDSIIDFLSYVYKRGREDERNER